MVRFEGLVWNGFGLLAYAWAHADMAWSPTRSAHCPFVDVVLILR
jgi:hypothetical protein